MIRAQESGEVLREGFLHPPDDARPLMRWWWFGPAVTKPELSRELSTMRDAGIGGVEIQPVYPLALDDASKGIRNLEYLSPEFLDDLNYANRTARSLGMRVDLTLGSGWPFGGPRTPLRLAAGRLRVAVMPIDRLSVKAPALAEGESLIAGFVVVGTEKHFDALTAFRLDLAAVVNGAVPVPPKPGVPRTVLFFIASHTGQQVKRAAFGAEGNVLDHFARAAIEEHIHQVGEPLLSAFGDEPPYAVFSDSLEVYDSDWTPDLPAEFEKRRGYDLISHLPELLAGGTPQAEAVRHDWGRTLAELVRENYLALLTQFAESHGTRFRSQTYGDPAVTLADEAVPALPEGEGPQWRAFSYTRWAASAGHLYGRNVISAETWTWLHSPAFRATPLDMKTEADRMFLEGVNQLVGHGYPYSPPGVSEPGWAFYAAAALNSHNPWFPVMPAVMSYMQRVSWLLRQGKPSNDVAILLPEDDGQAAFSPGHVSVTDEMSRRVSPALMTAILDAGYNMDFIDAATINKLGTVPYPVLVLPPTERIPLETAKILQRNCTTVRTIDVSEIPSLAPGLMEQKNSAEIAERMEQILFGAECRGQRVDTVSELPAVLHRAMTPDMEVSGKVAGLGFIHRKLADADIYFVVNTGNQTVDGAVRFRAARKNAEAWDPDSGRVMPVELTEEGGAERIVLKLAPYESRIFVLSDWADGGMEQKKAPAKPLRLADLSDGWRIQFHPGTPPQPLAHLTSWTEIAGEQNFSGEAIYSRSFHVDARAREGERLWLDFGAGTPIPDNRPPDANGMHALLDPPIRAAAIVFVNGKRAAVLWHPPYRVEITKLVHAGANRLEVWVYNTAINRMAGEPAADLTALRAKYGTRFEPQDMENLKPVPSGMLGKVTLLKQVSGELSEEKAIAGQR